MLTEVMNLFCVSLNHIFMREMYIYFTLQFEPNSEPKSLEVDDELDMAVYASYPEEKYYEITEQQSRKPKDSHHDRKGKDKDKDKSKTRYR